MPTRVDFTREAKAALIPWLSTHGFEASSNLVFHQPSPGGISPVVSVDLDHKARTSFIMHVGVVVRRPGSRWKPEEGFAVHRLLSRKGLTVSHYVWSCDPPERFARSLRDVVVALEAYLFPWVAQFVTLDDVLKEVPWTSFEARAQFAIELEEFDRAREVIRKGLEHYAPLAEEPWARLSVEQLLRLQASIPPRR